MESQIITKNELKTAPVNVLNNNVCLIKLKITGRSCVTNRRACVRPSVEQVHEIKYLAIILDNKVTCKSHTEKFKTKL